MNFLYLVFAFVMGLLALAQNRYGQFSDIGPFYGMHFADGNHAWPFSQHTLVGSEKVMHPVEYPALTGLIMWLISFLVKSGEKAALHYYYLTATFQIILFSISAILIKKLSGNRSVYLFVLAPAVLYSLNRNWDIWAIVTMLYSIYLFDNQKFKQSAFWLAISTATKFFPLVLILPIAIKIISAKEIKKLINFLVIFVGTWLIINLPFMIINLRGWSYFYEFSYKREIGSASIFDILNLIGFEIPHLKFVFYTVNVASLFFVCIYLIKHSRKYELQESAYLVLFFFILFNKQYSMQYIIWLTALAVLAMFNVSKIKQKNLFYIFVIWQLLDLMLQYSFFQNILTSYFANTDIPVSPQISSSIVGVVGLLRYFAISLFTFYLYNNLNSSKKLNLN